MQEVTKLSPYCAKLFSDLNPLMLMDEELYLEEIDKNGEKHKGVFLEYENISFDFHDRIRSQLKFLKFKFDDEYTVNRKYDGSDSKHIKTDNSSKSKFTVYF